MNDRPTLAAIAASESTPTWALPIVRGILRGDVDPVDAANGLEVLARAASDYAAAMLERPCPICGLERDHDEHDPRTLGPVR